MIQDIIFVILVVIAAGAGVWVWWREVHGEIPQPPMKKEEENN